MIQFVDKTSALSAVASVDIQTPESAVEGHLMVAIIAMDQNASARSIIPPPGWTLIGLEDKGTLSTTSKMAMYYRFYQDGDPVSFVWSFTGAVDSAGVILTYSGVDTVTPLNVQGHQWDGADTNITAPDVSPDKEDTMYVGAWMSDTDSITFTPPPELDIVHLDIGIDVRLLVGEERLGRDENTSTRVAVASSAGDVIGFAAVLNEAAVIVGPFKDNYKSKLARQTIPPTFNNKLRGVLGKIITVAGTSDNDVGGLSEEEDFLPDETP